MDIDEIVPLLREKVLAVAGASLPKGPPAPVGHTPSESPPEVRVACAYEVVVVGASTGGPRALVEILSRLPVSFPAGIVVAQHMPTGFTETLAVRLDGRSELEVLEANDFSIVQAGRVLLAPGGMQITLERRDGNLVARVSEGPQEQLHRPSVNLLFHSTAEIVGDRAIAVVITGMGDDGAEGLLELRDAGARTLAESEESAVIYGMPRAAASAAERVLPLAEIAGALVEITREPVRSAEAG